MRPVLRSSDTLSILVTINLVRITMPSKFAALKSRMFGKSDSKTAERGLQAESIKVPLTPATATAYLKAVPGGLTHLYHGQKSDNSNCVMYDAETKDETLVNVRVQWCMENGTIEDLTMTEVEAYRPKVVPVTLTDEAKADLADAGIEDVRAMWNLRFSRGGDSEQFIYVVCRMDADIDELLWEAWFMMPGQMPLRIIKQYLVVKSGAGDIILAGGNPVASATLVTKTAEEEDKIIRVYTA